MTQVVCYIDASQDLYAFSKLHTGLCLLAARGELELRFASPGRERKFFCGQDVTALAVRSDGETRLAAIDVYDRADVFGHELLDASDVYLKRSYQTGEIARLPAANQNKVLPFGMNYACRNRRTWEAGIPRLLGSFMRSLANGPAAWRRDKGALIQLLFIPNYRRFEQSPSAPLQPEILFQTRVWTQEESDTEPIEPLNEERVALVRALRKSFPRHFRGGVIPTPLARLRYPDALTTEATRPAQYLAAHRRSLIGISTRGLHHSVPFKLPEYMAGAKCIVSEPLRNQLPEPLVDRREYVEFRGVDECLAVCDELLRWPERAASLRRAAWQYYQEHVEPAAHARNCLARIMAPLPQPALAKAAAAK